jgi:hypothetical protein
MLQNPIIIISVYVDIGIRLNFVGLNELTFEYKFYDTSNNNNTEPSNGNSSFCDQKTYRC